MEKAISDGQYFGRNTSEILRQKLAEKMSERDRNIVIVSLMLEDFYDVKYVPEIANQAIAYKLGWFEDILYDLGMSELLDRIVVDEGFVVGGRFLKGEWK